MKHDYRPKKQFLVTTNNFHKIKDESGTIAVINSSAQSTKLYREVSEGDSIKSKAEAFITTDTIYPSDFHYLIYILLVCGCRVSEVLKIKGSDVTGNYYIKITASKGSNDRIVFVPRIKGQELVQGGNKGLLFSNYSRFYVYRFCKKYGLYIITDGMKNNKVTHSFRNLYADNVLELSEGTKTASDAMGHKSLRSISYYGTKSKK